MVGGENDKRAIEQPSPFQAAENAAHLFVNQRYLAVISRKHAPDSPIGKTVVRALDTSGGAGVNRTSRHSGHSPGQEIHPVGIFLFEFPFATGGHWNHFAIVHAIVRSRRIPWCVRSAEGDPAEKRLGDAVQIRDGFRRRPGVNVILGGQRARHAAVLRVFRKLPCSPIRIRVALTAEVLAVIIRLAAVRNELSFALGELQRLEAKVFVARLDGVELPEESRLVAGSGKALREGRRIRGQPGPMGRISFAFIDIDVVDDTMMPGILPCEYGGPRRGTHGGLGICGAERHASRRKPVQMRRFDDRVTCAA